ncbi:MAG: DUF4215 domain-containing protein [Myxococcales bacterium]|nr:DUF4215 domain-containing protein [Myxococcales bacterium]
MRTGTGLARPTRMNATRLHSSSISLAFALSALFAACAGGVGDDANAELSQVAQSISDGLSGAALVAPTQVALAEGLFSIPSATPLAAVNAETCSEIEGMLNQSCQFVQGLSDDTYCWAESTFFMAHSQPRCASRLHLGGALERIYALDLTGQVQEGPPEKCGDGIIDDEEQCDDGNHEDFDGCSQLCEVEEFQGCEAVIEQYYQQAEIAFVDKDLWDGPRSHLMINKTVKALSAVDERTCNAALSVGVDVCRELTRQMSFVSSCQPMGGLRQTEDAAACDLRFHVNFQTVSPLDGVFTTAMPGVLAFTISE